MSLKLKVSPFVEKLKSDPPILLVCALVCSFWLGRTSHEVPPKSEICRDYIEEISLLKTHISNLEDKIKLLEAQLERCRKECDARIRTKLDAKEVECTSLISEKLKDVKENYIHFKCQNCKKLGRCK